VKRSGLKRPTLAQVQAFDRKPRTPLRRGRKPIPQMSTRRISEREQRAEVIAAAFARDGYLCRARALVPEVVCAGPLDPHEVIPRSAWAAGYLVLDNVLSICRSHHAWIDAEPEKAHERGLHAYSWERP
jgi:hypothetical protein